MKTIYEYYVKAFDSEPQDETLQELPIESGCGEDCKKAIDAGVELAKHEKAAHGSTIETALLVETIISTYWRG